MIHVFYTIMALIGMFVFPGLGPKLFCFGVVGYGLGNYVESKLRGSKFDF